MQRFNLLCRNKTIRSETNASAPINEEIAKFLKNAMRKI